MTVKVEVTKPKKFKSEEIRRAVQNALPLADLAAILAAEIRERVRERGETARGGRFILHVRPLRSAGDLQWIPRRWLDEAPAQASTKSRARRNRWEGASIIQEDPGRERVLVRVPRPGPRPTGQTQTFNFTGEAWRNLKVQVTSKGRVRVGFAGSATPGFGGSPVRNALKMTVQNAPHADHLLAPSESEVQGMLDGMSAELERELRYVLDDAHAPAMTTKGNRRVAQRIVQRKRGLLRR